MAWRCFVVYPLPRVADESFLQLIFDGSVARSVFVGTPPHRFALVELRDDKHADAVLHAIGDTPQSLTGTVAAVAGQEDGEDHLDCMLMDLFSSCEGRTRKTQDDAQNASSADGTEMVCIPHLKRLCFYKTLLQVERSPITISELYNCGGQMPRNRADGRFTSKRPRSAVLGGETAPLRGDTTVKETKNGEVNTTVYGKKDQCHHCGSQEHLSRHCTAAAPRSSTAADGANVTGTNAPRTDRGCKAIAKAEFPANCCQKCGSSDHFTRHCVAEHNAEESVTKQQQGCEQEREKHQQQIKHARTAMSVSKEQCKHCGLDTHFSRHCPSK